MGTALTLQRPAGTAELSGARKVAILLMALGEEASSEITRTLPPEDVEAISFEIARLDRVDPAVMEAVLKEWKETETAAQFVAEGGQEYARRILVKAFGEQKANQILKRIEAQISETLTLAPLQKADPRQVAAVLRQEHPQTVALALAHLPARQTAGVLKEMSPELGTQVLFRMARMEKVLPDVLQLVERVLGSGTQISFTGNSMSSGGPEAVAGILNELASGLDRDLLDRMAGMDAELSGSIRDLMFVFEDVIRLDEQAMTRLLREVDTREMALALKVVSDPLREKMLAAMTGRARDALLEEMEFLGPVRVRDVEEAQGRVVAIVRQLEDDGEITLAGAADVLVG
ncbi:MAG: flagellar motor switch protein FliG [Gemmatimonadales bacterium]|nr:MAG: flagellar motor switch protein FliG [Gemmatimonadales bacterium]